MSEIGIVTDSTADMPADFYGKNRVRVVPLYVRFGEEVYKDWVDISPDEFYARMKTVTELPKTSQPSVEDFAMAYREFEGYDGIISIHLSGKLSGTIESASIAAQRSPVPVAVVDGIQASFATGMIVQEIVRAREEGRDLEELEEIANRLAREIKIAFYVDTLKYLEMGGRIGKAKYLAASLLKIKPILALVDGEVHPHKTVKGRAKVLEEMGRFVAGSASGGPVHMAYAYTDCPESIDEMKAAVASTGVEVASEVESRIGCVIGTYVGPGAFALIVRPAEG